MERDDVLLEHIASEAADWFTRLRESEISVEDRAQFTRWLLRSPDHIHEYMSIVRTWDDINLVQGDDVSPEAVTSQALATALPNNVVPLDREYAVSMPTLVAQGGMPRRRTRVFRAPRHLLLAAIAMVTCMFLAWLMSNQWFHPSHIQTAIGEQRAVTLADGSAINLNTDSEVQVDFEPAERRIHLIRGEARFVVAKDRARPFIVMTDNANVRAVGTVFNVRQTDGQTSVAVFEGRVAVGSVATEQRATPDLPHPESQLLHSADPHAVTGIARLPVSAQGSNALLPIELAAGERATVLAHGKILPDTGPPLERLRAWPHHRLVFRQETLKVLVTEVNRYHEHHLSIGDPSIAAVQISGTFSANDLDSLIEYLDRYRGIHADSTEEGGYVLSRAAR